MAKKSGWLTRLTGEGIKEFIWDLLRSWIWPLIVPTTTVVLGYAQGLPLMYIFLGGVSAFAFITHGLVKITEWRFIRTPEHKIEFTEPSIGVDFDPIDARKISKLHLGFRLRSKAYFPMEIELIKFKSRFMDRVPIDDMPKIRNLILGMSEDCFFNGGMIDIHDMDLKNKEIRSSFSFTINYGVQSNAKYTYCRDIDVTWRFDENGYYKVHVWSNSVEPLQ